ncbi:MAG: 30S ribosomal protein S20 [Candidatus Omnitrophota bacterium]|nr:30S ribosomal protein S20 [Candidatus Omnitrophota bacterium]
MAIKHAALKQHRKDRKRQSRNQAVRSELKTLTKRFATLVTTQKMDEARTMLHTLTSKFDRAVSKGIIHRNTAARYKSRLALRLNRK